ncbi:MAG: hypothetical protein ACI83P_000437 [Janthinobacterium sp.]|jgi:hypothetical protein
MHYLLDQGRQRKLTGIHLKDETKDLKEVGAAFEVPFLP